MPSDSNATSQNTKSASSSSSSSSSANTASKRYRLRHAISTFVSHPPAWLLTSTAANVPSKLSASSSSSVSVTALDSIPVAYEDKYYSDLEKSVDAHLSRSSRTNTSRHQTDSRALHVVPLSREIGESLDSEYEARLADFLQNSSSPATSPIDIANARTASILKHLSPESTTPSDIKGKGKASKLRHRRSM